MGIDFDLPHSFLKKPYVKYRKLLLIFEVMCIIYPLPPMTIKIVIESLRKLN